ncbi:MAG: RlmE family RNA methyltransferase [Maricaulaceae bacterium]|nr:RlmE family RNA methyltransferase [Maricaulaceae bacterium]
MSGEGKDGEEGEKRRRRRKLTKGGGERAAKQLAERVKTARGRTVSSQRWLQRQLNDPYVAKAKAAGYRSRAAYKLAELDDRFGLIPKGGRVADLGAAPGGWAQLALQRGAAHVVGIDLLEMEPVPGATFLKLDFTEPGAAEAVTAALGGPADAVFSDLAPWTTGHRKTDHLRIVALVEAAADFAMQTLKPGGVFVAKVFQGGTEDALLARLKQRFAKVRHAKPPASRAESAETFLIAQGFKG